MRLFDPMQATWTHSSPVYILEIWYTMRPTMQSNIDRCDFLLLLSQIIEEMLIVTRQLISKSYKLAGLAWYLAKPFFQLFSMIMSHPTLWISVHFYCSKMFTGTVVDLLGSEPTLLNMARRRSAKRRYTITQSNAPLTVPLITGLPNRPPSSTVSRRSLKQPLFVPNQVKSRSDSPLGPPLWASLELW